MSQSLLDKWLEHYDPIHRGWTVNGITNGVCATNGFGFPRIRGGYNLRRVPADDSNAPSELVGAAGADATTVRTFPWVSHDAGRSYVYRLAAINGGGVENAQEPAATEVSFDQSGLWTGRRPNAPGDLRVTPSAGGTFIIRWTYVHNGEQDEPAAFYIHHDNGNGEIDYSSAAGSVPYRRGQLHYRYVSARFAHDQLVRWAVRAVTAAGVNDGNSAVSAARAENRPPPPAVSIVLASA